ncbi:MAG: hypothetical protein JWP44_5056 [Mucilaginibacter sp.]|nr:hypothetical protein [Mucilaginibacter sp.]
MLRLIKMSKGIFTEEELRLLEQAIMCVDMAQLQRPTACYYSAAIRESAPWKSPRKSPSD